MTRYYTNDSSINTLTFVDDLPNGNIQCICPKCGTEVEINSKTEVCPSCKSDLWFPTWCSW